MWCYYVITCNAAISRASVPSSFCVYSGCLSLKTKRSRLMSCDSACFPFSSFFPRLLCLDLPSPASTSTSSTASHHSSSHACCFTATCAPPHASRTLTNLSRVCRYFGIPLSMFLYAPSISFLSDAYLHQLHFHSPFSLTSSLQLRVLLLEFDNRRLRRQGQKQLTRAARAAFNCMPHKRF
jgi:hypothetical protein